jgi:hypothetical protein
MVRNLPFIKLTPMDGLAKLLPCFLSNEVGYSAKADGG